MPRDSFCLPEIVPAFTLLLTKGSTTVQSKLYILCKTLYSVQCLTSSSQQPVVFRDFDIGSILRPTPIKPESVCRIRESQEGPSQTLPIHSLHTPDLAALQGSQGIATSLSVLQNNLQSHGWQHTDGASQQSGPGLNGAAPILGHSQQGSQEGHPPAQTQNGAASHADHITHPFDRSFGLSQQQLQQSQQGSQTWDSGSQQMPTASGSASQQYTRPPKRKLPFSTGLQPDLKRQSPGPAPVELPA